MATKVIIVTGVLVVLVLAHLVVIGFLTQRNENTLKTKKFKLVDDDLRIWQEALDHCNSHGMKLATINSQQEQDTVMKLILSTQVFIGRVWLGGSDLGDTGNYIWRSTNTTLSYTNWDLLQPDNMKYSNGDQDHCISLSQYSHGKWWDIRCNYWTLHHVCEYYG